MNLLFINYGVKLFFFYEDLVVMKQGLVCSTVPILLR